MYFSPYCYYYSINFTLRWSDVLSHSIHAYNMHTDICKLSSNDDFSIQRRHLDLLVELRRKALQGVSRTAYQLFENNQVRPALQQANSALVPGLGAMSANPHEGDVNVLEAVREEWCQYLNHPGLSEGKGTLTTYCIYHHACAHILKLNYHVHIRISITLNL